MPRGTAGGLRIGLVGTSEDASNWRALLSRHGSETAVAETLDALPSDHLDLILVFTESVNLPQAAQKCADPGQPPSALLLRDPGRVHPLTLLLEALAEAAREPEASEPKPDRADTPRDWTASAARAGLTLDELERQYIRTVLDVHHGHRGKTARALGLDPKTLYNKLGASRPRKGRALQGGEAGR